MIGMLREIVNYEPQRNSWFEVDNQVILYQHPKLFHYLHLCRLKPMDISRMALACLHEFLLWPQLWLTGFQRIRKDPMFVLLSASHCNRCSSTGRRFTAWPILQSFRIFCLISTYFHPLQIRDYSHACFHLLNQIDEVQNEMHKVMLNDKRKVTLPVKKSQSINEIHDCIFLTSICSYFSTFQFFSGFKK